MHVGQFALACMVELFLALIQSDLNNKIVVAPPYRKPCDILIDFLQDMPRKTQERIKFLEENQILLA